MTLSAYSNLKQQIIIGAAGCGHHERLLKTLKGLFEADINSPRRLEKISSIGQLLKVLEIRYILSEENVEPLKQIVRQLPNGHELMLRINEYEAIPKDHSNGYDSCHFVIKLVQTEVGVKAVFYVLSTTLLFCAIAAIQTTQRPSKPPVHVIGSNPYGQMSDEKRRRIKQTVIDEIGSSWRDLARNLNIREVVINDIDSNNKTLARKATKLIERFEANCDPDKWFFELSDALEKSRRKDLSKDIKKILLMNI